MVSPFLFNTEQYSLYSCNMTSRVEVRNFTDKLLGVKISLLRMASGGFFKHKYFSKVSGSIWVGQKFVWVFL